MQPTAPRLAPGNVFAGRYQIVRCLRAGGMGAVYEVIHFETRRRRALKVMLPELVVDEELRARFRLEATIAADIESDHIVETLDAGIDPESGSPFLVMELLRGRDLADVMLERRLTPHEVVVLLGQAALALEKTHRAGIIHRDLKPENLFLTKRDDETPRLKVLDFRIAKVIRQPGAKMTQAVGTPPYMAPEQIEGAPTLGPRADLYALAHIAYALLVGRPYFGDDSALAVLARVLKGPIERPSERAARSGVQLPPAFDAWFQTAAAPDPHLRFGSAAVMIGTMAVALGVDAFRKAAAGGMTIEKLEVALTTTAAATPKLLNLVAPSKLHAFVEEPTEVAAPRTRASPGMPLPPAAMARGDYGSIPVVMARSGPVVGTTAPPQAGVMTAVAPARSASRTGLAIAAVLASAAIVGLGIGTFVLVVQQRRSGDVASAEGSASATTAPERSATAIAKPSAEASAPAPRPSSAPEVTAATSEPAPPPPTSAKGESPPPSGPHPPPTTHGATTRPTAAPPYVPPPPPTAYDPTRTR